METAKMAIFLNGASLCEYSPKDRFGSTAASQAYSSPVADFGVKRTLASQNASGCFRPEAAVAAIPPGSRVVECA
jgi:hypothetical protein